MSYRHVTGKVATAQDRMASFESSLERDWLIVLDFDVAVLDLLEQPFTVHYEHEGKQRRYTPDVSARFDKGESGTETIVYEVKYIDELKKRWQEFRPRYLAANHYCRERGWRFSLVTEREIRTPFLENASFLRQYRFIVDQPLVRMQLIYTLQALGPTTPEGLMAATYSSSEARGNALATLWCLVATRRIAADLNRPLTMRSAIRFVDAPL